MACWRQTRNNIGCPTQWWGREYQIDNIIDNPLLPYPDYIPHVIQNCQNPSGDGCLIDSYWGQYCDPPRHPYPIVNVESWPIIRSPITLDTFNSRQPTTTAPVEYYLDRGFAIACRIAPTAKCLPYVVLHDVLNMAPGTNIVVEIRKNDPTTSLPKGIPQDNDPNNLYEIVETGFATNSCGNVYGSVPVNAMIDTVGEDVWIVLHSKDYACSGAYVGTRRLRLKKSDVGINNLAVFSPANGCQWAIDNTVKSIALATYIATSCNGSMVVNDFAFAKIGNPPIYLNSNCFVFLSEVQDSKVAVGVIYTNPDPIRTWKRVRLSFAYLKPDLRYFTQTIDIFDVSPGQHEAFFAMTDTYFPGKYDQLAVSAAVIQV